MGVRRCRCCCAGQLRFAWSVCSKKKGPCFPGNPTKLLSGFGCDQDIVSVMAYLSVLLIGQTDMMLFGFGFGCDQDIVSVMAYLSVLLIGQTDTMLFGFRG